jgi:hypothetical protein
MSFFPHDLFHIQLTKSVSKAPGTDLLLMLAVSSKSSVNDSLKSKSDRLRSQGRKRKTKMSISLLNISSLLQFLLSIEYRKCHGSNSQSQ